MAKVKLSDWDVVNNLDSDEMIAEYLTAAYEENDPEFFLHAINDVIRAKGMARIAEQTGLGRESLYKAFRPGAKPRHETVVKVLNALGIQMSFKPV